MDISGVMTSAASQASKSRTGDSIGIAVQKMAMDAEAQTAAELINSVVHESQEVPSDKLPPHLGRNIDVTA
jgi:hypothetical protein